jgi:3-hydroxy-9,10-secoandrosta-1,3,5(10)-triene-9,17-dione monooxygenase
MTTVQTAEQADAFEKATDRLIERTRVLVPTLRARALEAQQLRYQVPQTIKDAEFLMDALVPKVWGGQGLGSRALCEVARVLAHGDASSAWTLAFLMEHSWMAAHLNWAAQKEIFDGRTFILAAAPLTPAGKAERVDGGYRVTGTYRYASGVWNADYTFLTSMVTIEGVMTPLTFLVELNQEGVTVNDDWHMSGMAATGSASVTLADVFVRDIMSIPLEDLLSIDKHPGVAHEETFLRYPPFASLGMMITAIGLGCAEAVADIVRTRLSQTRAFGGAMRADLPQSRLRFAQAWEKVRCAQLLYQHNLEHSIRKCDAMEPWSQEEIGQIELDQTTVIHLAQEAIGILCDGMGSSPYQTKEPMQRYRRDIDVIANHAFMDWDLVAERSIRYVLGLGTRSTDMFRSQVTSQGGISGDRLAGGSQPNEEKTMKAAVLNEVGGVPAVGDFAAPVPGPGESVAEVIVAALNPIDRRLAQGGPFGPPIIPSVVGQEGVARLEDGAKVYFSDAKPPYGAIAEQVLLGDRSRVYRIPDGLDEGLAVALGTSGITALTALQWRAQVRAGDSVLVVGASGVLGQLGTQIARLLGAGRVVAAARHVETLEKLKAAGAADEIVVLGGGDDAAALKAAAPEGCDVVLDGVMGPVFGAALAATKFGARYVVVGMNGGPQASITYPTLTGRSIFGHLKPLVPADEWEGAYAQLCGWANAGQLKVDVERVPVENIAEAWELQGNAPHRKLVIQL